MSSANAQADPGYDDLLALFAEWRDFESPPLLDGAPDYTAEQFAARQDDYESLRARLNAFVIDDWPVPQQVDWHLVPIKTKSSFYSYHYDHYLKKLNYDII